MLTACILRHQQQRSTRFSGYIVNDSAVPDRLILYIFWFFCNHFQQLDVQTDLQSKKEILSTRDQDGLNFNHHRESRDTTWYQRCYTLTPLAILNRGKQEIILNLTTILNNDFTNIIIFWGKALLLINIFPKTLWMYFFKLLLFLLWFICIQMLAMYPLRDTESRDAVIVIFCNVSKWLPSLKTGFIWIDFCFFKV